MNKTSEVPRTQVFNGDCLEVLRGLPDASVDSVVTDPPYAIGSAAARTSTSGDDAADGACQECGNDNPAEGYRTCSDCLAEAESGVMQANMLGMQSQNWDEKATHSRGYVDNDPDVFEAWCVLWATECHRVLKPGGHLVAFGGTPTWHRLARGIELAEFTIRGSMAWLYATGFPKGVNVEAAINGSKSIGGSARQGAGERSGLPGALWAGWGTTLKPAHEPIVLARKSLEGTVASNVLRHGTGALNIDGCRVRASDGSGMDGSVGRWPSDVFLSHTAAGVLEEKAGGRPVAEFFWHPKPGQSERVVVNGVAHPTVKPLGLMRELVRLVTPPGGVVLDPFAGSGTTVEASILEGFAVIAVEREAAYLPLIQQRIARQVDPVRAVLGGGGDPGLFAGWS
ncbi:site-specific DNA-methyltransferase [Nocardioides sp. 1609]|uniref:DNA-methyltransferase n=1 Tax=Nocardioides sp. 1609 TaxID=2508327 RepID=UPI00143213A3|nr:site-specific DNA-methyltransferase [Nocardioides sp. 1609]